MTKPVVIFDLDGTLADTAPDLIAVLNRITARFELHPLGREIFGNIIGQGAKAMIARAFELQNRQLGGAELDNLFDEFIKDYTANIAVHTSLFEGAMQAIGTLENSGCRFAVCTNKPEYLARQLLEELGVLDTFAAITGGNTFAFKKPDGRHILETIKMAGSNKASAIMIGDSSADIKAAKNARIASIAVRFGYSDQPVESLGADVIISSFAELPEAVYRLLDIS